VAGIVKILKKGQRVRQSYDHALDLSSIPNSSDVISPEYLYLRNRLDRMRSAARYWMRETPYGPIISRNYIAGIIGHKFPRPKPMRHSAWPAVMDAWKRWAQSPEAADWSGEEDLQGILATGIHHLLADGEMFYRVHPGAPIRLEAVDPGRVPLYEYADGRNGTMGVEFDKAGRRTHYYIWPRPDIHSDHTLYWQNVSERVPARAIFHWRLPNLSHSIRGTPIVWSIVALGSNVNSFNIGSSKNAELLSKRIGITKSDEAAQAYTGDEAVDPDDDDSPDELLGYWSDDFEMRMTNLPPGVDMSIQDGKFPTDTETFLRPISQQMAAAAGISSHGFTGDTKSVNFSAGRLGRLEQEQTMRQAHAVLCKKVLRPLWMRWLARHIQARTIPGLMAADFETLRDPEWLPPPQPPADQRVQAMADSMNLEAGLTSRRQIIENRGDDYERICKDREDEREREAAYASDSRQDSVDAGDRSDDSDESDGDEQDAHVHHIDLQDE